MVFNLNKEGFYIINGALLKGNPVKDYKGFWEMHKHNNDDIKDLLMKSQPYFQSLKNGSISIDDEGYYIYATQEYLDKGIATYASEICGSSGECLNAHYVYVKKPLIVSKHPDGYYYAGYDGRHRFVTAQEYNLDILVKVI